MIAVYTSSHPSPPLPPYFAVIISPCISISVSIYYRRAVLIVLMFGSPRSLESTCFGVALTAPGWVGPNLADAGALGNPSS